MTEFAIRPLSPIDALWLSQTIKERWGSEIVVVHDTVYTPAELPGFVAVDVNKPIGLVTYHIENTDCEIVLLDSFLESVGIGTRLLEEVRMAAEDAGCRRLWAITTNDNIDAIRFYQTRGFSMVAVHRDAVTRARRMKPEIPQVGNYEIPVKDEIELEMNLA